MSFVSKSISILLCLLGCLLILAAGNFFINAQVNDTTRYIFSALLLIDGIGYFIILTTRKLNNKLIQYGALAFITLNTLLTLLDQVGIIDMLIIAANLYVFSALVSFIGVQETDG